jgi:hypothetical protein
MLILLFNKKLINSIKKRFSHSHTLTLSHFLLRLIFFHNHAGVMTTKTKSITKGCVHYSFL